MNWTTTKVPLWQIDAENFRQVGRPFEIRDVGPEHEEFVAHFFARHHITLTMEREGTIVRFKPKGV